MLVCLYLNLKHGNLDRLATTAGWERGVIVGIYSSVQKIAENAQKCPLETTNPGNFQPRIWLDIEKLFILRWIVGSLSLPVFVLGKDPQMSRLRQVTSDVLIYLNAIKSWYDNFL